jgi:hypothetical protein
MLPLAGGVTKPVLTRESWNEVKRFGFERFFSVERRKILRRLETMLVDLQGFDLRVQGLSWYCKSGCCASGARDPAPGGGQCGLDHFLFALVKCSLVLGQPS